MALDNIFVFKKTAGGSYDYVPASGLLFGLGTSGTIILGDQTNSITGQFNSILGGSYNSIQNNSTRSIIGGGGGNTIKAGNGNFITAGANNYISGAFNSSNVIVGGCTNVILGNQSIIGGGCGNFLGAGLGENLYQGARTNSILGGEYNCAFAANPFDASSIYSMCNGWNGFSFGGPIYYNPPCESVIVGGLQNRIGGCRSFVGAGSDNFAIKNYSTIINGCSNRASSCNASIINGCEIFVANGCYNSVINGGCNFIGANFGESIISANANNQTYYASIGNGLCNKITSANGITLTYSSIGNGSCNTIASGSSYAFIGNGCNNRISQTGDFDIILGGCNNAIRAVKFSSILGGKNNVIRENYYSSIGMGTNIIIGGESNTIASYYATIGGGFGNSLLSAENGFGVIVGGASNTGTFNAVIVGGSSNSAGAGSFIGGGAFNSATLSSSVVGGSSNQALESHGFIGGGFQNQILTSSYHATIGGGYKNIVGGKCSVVGGGAYNCAYNFYTSVLGGLQNKATATYANVGGGKNNCATASSATVGGGFNNCAAGVSSSVGGGCFNKATANYSNVAGGLGNSATGYGATIGGGHQNTAGFIYSTIAGGRSNCVGAGYTNIGGGKGNCSTAVYANVAGGNRNCALGYASSIGGGRDNKTLPLNSNGQAACFTFIGGGEFNCAQNNYSTVLGGLFNCALGEWSFAIGGRRISIPTTHNGAGVISDGQDRAHNSSGSNSLVIDFASGVYFPQPNVYFKGRPTVNGSGVLLQGEGGSVSVANIVYTTGSQTISSSKNFTVRPTFNSINIPTVNEVVNLTSAQTVAGAKNFTSRPQFNSVDIPTVNEVVDLTNTQTVNGEKDFLIRPTVNGTGVLLIGEAAGAGGEGIVLISGNQTISGSKVFTQESQLQVQNIVFTTSSGQSNFIYQVNQTQNQATGSPTIDYIDQGLALTRGVGGFPYNIYGDSLDNYYEFYNNPSGTLWNIEGWSDLSGVENRQYSNIENIVYPYDWSMTGTEFVMWDTKNNKYYKIQFTTWNDYGDSYPTYGLAGFTYTRQRIGSHYIQNIRISGEGPLFLSGQLNLTEAPLVSGVPLLKSGDQTIIYTTGNQNLTGVKNFLSRPTVNNSGILLFGEGTPVPIQVFGNGTSQGNASSLNFAGGGISVNTVAGQATITVSATTQTTNVPATSTSPGASGSFAFDDRYIYYCKRNNRWVRAALSEW